ncbi:SDR family NAD(P)-dependent oxidoreductase [Mesonia aquimarina]|uniref:SDR family NAD(P)-dependent oxidoreductase n=1 Tax=Mesonia aquimarina TaxID=1504967 RepID=UPI000EF59DDE|nr:SDR family NAD(P)-dependent oxidoreductase [Mesonia aquimarina]
MKKLDTEYTLITGASKGLGKAIAFELAQRNINLLLVALPNEGLEKIAGNLNNSKIIVDFKELDISNTDEREDFLQLVKKEYRLSGLINNAGMGGNEYFLNEKLSEMHAMLEVNIVAAVLCTRSLFPLLLKNKNSYILNISSLAAFSPIAYKSVYPATKGFIHQFTLSLQEEFKNKDILISVVHPGPMRTNNEISNRLKNRGYLTRKLTLSPDDAAKAIVRKLFKRKSIIYLHSWQRLAYILMRIIPTPISVLLLSRIARKELKNRSK